MRRVLASLKYVPAVLCGMLVVAWVASIWGHARIIWPYSSSQAIDAGVLRIHASVIEFRYDPQGFHELVPAERRPITHSGWSMSQPSIVEILGSAGYEKQTVWEDEYSIHLRIPLPALLSCVLPLACGCLTRFRFPLWSYFAWTALLAAELAYYLR
jgi:hypothetical protein